MPSAGFPRDHDRRLEYHLPLNSRDLGGNRTCLASGCHLEFAAIVPVSGLEAVAYSFFGIRPASQA